MRGVVLLAGALALQATGCGAQRRRALTIGVRTANDHAPFYIADAHELYARQGIEAEVLVLGSNTEIIEGLRRGALQMGAVPVTTAIAAIAQGAPITVVAMTGRGSDGLLAAPEGPTDVKDLAGERIGSIRASILDVLLRLALEEAGLSAEHDVEIRYVSQLGELNTALRAGHVAAISTTEPFMTEAEEQGWGRIIAYYTAYWPDHPCCVVLAHHDLLARQPDLARAALAAHCQAVDWANAHPAETAAIIAERLGGLDPGLVERSLAPHKMRIDYHVSGVELVRMAEIMARQGLVAEPPPEERLLDPAPLRDALREVAG